MIIFTFDGQITAESLWQQQIRVIVGDTFRPLAPREDLSQLVPRASQGAEPRFRIRSWCNSNGSVRGVPFWRVARVTWRFRSCSFTLFSLPAGSFHLLGSHKGPMPKGSAARPGDPDDRAESKLPGPVSLGMHWASLMCLPEALKDRPSCPTHAT